MPGCLSTRALHSLTDPPEALYSHGLLDPFVVFFVSCIAKGKCIRYPFLFTLAQTVVDTLSVRHGIRCLAWAIRRVRH